MKTVIDRKKLFISLILSFFLILLITLNRKAFVLGNSFNYTAFILSILLPTISSIIFSIKIEFKSITNSVFAIFSFMLSIVFSYIIIELLNKNVLFSINIKRMLFNFIIIIFMHLFIYAITNRVNLSIIISNIIIFIIGIINYTVFCFRGTPIVPWDILSLKVATYVAANYTFTFSYHLLLSISLFIFIISLGLKSNFTYKKQKINNVFRFVCLSIILFSTIIFYKTDVIEYFDFETNLWQPTDEYLNNGFLASFVKQSKNLFNDVPDNYSSQTVEFFLNKYDLDDKIIQPNDTVNNSDNPNIIVIMSESYSDLSVNRRF